MTAFHGSIAAEPLSEEGWAPFGWLPLNDTDPRDGASRLTFEWSDVHLNIIHHDLGEVAVTGHGVVCDVVFRHLTHTQALLVLNCPAVIAVAAPDAPLREDDDVTAHLRAFLLQPGDAFVLHQGTWHWGPFPVGFDRVDLYNVQGLNYAKDNDSFDLSAAGKDVEVRTDGSN